MRRATRPCAGGSSGCSRPTTGPPASWNAAPTPARPTPRRPGGPPLLPERVFAGRFKLRQKLGEGGMGEVWVADQTEPVQRRVAIKVIRPGLDSERMLARFEQERQALALMDHPNIAKVLDAGEADGRPYFVMELIKGVPITEYCDRARLSPRERLELFVPVCQAVQHAHQKGVVHRDLKPSNILVALYDGRPVPKVIDFGIAKATGPRLTDRSIYTEVGALIGTLEYMAPEQAELNNLDIDTRADVYALGAILYELLTGSVPFSRQELQAAGFLEMLRVIREVEPPRPSTKLSKSGTLPSVADVRRTDPQKLVSLMGSPDGNRLATGASKGWRSCGTRRPVRRSRPSRGTSDPSRRSHSVRTARAWRRGAPTAPFALWDMTARRDAISIPQDGLLLTAIAELSPDGQTLLTEFDWRARRPLGLWDTATGEPRCGPIELPLFPEAAGLDRRRRTSVLHGRQDRQRRGTWRPARWSARSAIDARDGSLWHRISPDDKWFAHAGRDGTIQVRDAETGAEIRTIEGLDDRCRALVFNPDGTRLLSVDQYGTLKLWDFATGARSRRRS